MTVLTRYSNARQVGYIVDADQVEIGHTKKVLFPHSGIVKQQLAEYYERISPILIPYLENRPLTLKQFPEGIDQPGFFRKHVPKHFPAYIKRTPVERVDTTLEPIMMATVDESADLKYLSGQNVIELHMTTARIEDLHSPDQLVFDLDPAGSNFDKVRHLALAFKRMFDSHGLPSFIKLSGRKGVHIHIPIKPQLPYCKLKPWTKKIADDMVRAYPDIATVEHLHSKRGSKVYIDILRNDYTQTVVAPYSVRAMVNAPVSAPIDWYELNRDAIHPGYVTISNIHRRLGQKLDPWADFSKRAISAHELPFFEK